jgi:hypothetical protein
MYKKLKMYHTSFPLPWIWQGNHFVHILVYSMLHQDYIQIIYIMYADIYRVIYYISMLLIKNQIIKLFFQCFLLYCCSARNYFLVIFKVKETPLSNAFLNLASTKLYYGFHTYATSTNKPIKQPIICFYSYYLLQLPHVETIVKWFVHF